VEQTRPTGSLDGATEPFRAATIAALLGVRDFLDALPELSARRAWLQAGRRRADADIVGRFSGHWLSAVPSPNPPLHLALREPLLHALGILDTRDSSSRIES
jgi:hypothetical protein